MLASLMKRKMHIKNYPVVTTFLITRMKKI